MMKSEEFAAELRQAVHKFDLVIRPYILLLNPVDKKRILEAVPDLEDRYVVYELSTITSGKAYVIDRAKMEEQTLFDFIMDKIFVL